MKSGKLLAVLASACALVLAPLTGAAADVPPAAIGLAGTWRFAADTSDTGAKASPDQWRFPDAVKLPGQVAAQGFGEVPSFRTQWTGSGWRYPRLFKEWQADGNFKMPFFLQPPRRYVAPAWYQKDVEIPADWAGFSAVLFLERVHWQSRVWVDGRPAGGCDSLGTPHEFDLGALAPGHHVITLRIDNRILDVNPGMMAHSVTDHTQGNWNGVVGRMELRPASALRFADVRIDPSFAGKSVKVTVLANTNGAGRVAVRLRPAGGAFAAAVPADLADGQAEVACPVADPKAWNEFTPNLYEAEVTLESAAGRDVRRAVFGFRDLGHKDGRFTLNGHPIFLRGALDCCAFPLTGYPPTNVAAWRRIIRVCKAHGLNHIRFHSWCPPEAAFIAADEEGFYYQVEASAWASNGGAQIGNGWPLDGWIYAETARMLRAYGNHPSFLMMDYGNEPGGRNHAKWLQDYVAHWKHIDGRRFWTTASGWPERGGSDYFCTPKPRIQGWNQGMKSIINSQPPRTDFDWGDYVRSRKGMTIVSHEVGQWCAYPDFDEAFRYIGFFKARNFEIFRETAIRNGLFPQTRDFLYASGRLQTLCYKHDIEAALRTPGFGGFQLLGLADFPGQGTALVGALNAFWEPKGYVSAAEYASFAGPVVPLARLPKMVWRADETLTADLELCHFGPEDFKGLEPCWSLMAGGRIVATGRLPARDCAAGALHELGSIHVPLAAVPAPAELKLAVGATGRAFTNSWDLFVYPAKIDIAVPAGVTFTRSLDAALAALAQGGTVLWMPSADEVVDDPARPLVAGFPTIFWNTAWTNWQPPHTLGILCDPKHPALAAFPTESHSNWQWWELQKDARPFILTPDYDLRPVVQLIDDWVTNRKLGYVFEAKVGTGRLLACSFDLETGLDARVAARQLRASLLAYLSGGHFNPSCELSPAALRALVRVAGPAKKEGK